MLRTLASLLLLAALAMPAAAQESMNSKTLAQLKAATVYVKVKVGGGEAVGSGFVIRVDGEDALVVTNEHVVNPKPDSDGGPPFGPRFPRRPFGPFPGPLGGGGARTCEVVFNSGRQGEKVVKADVLAADGDVDLAVLKVTGVKDLPKPVELSAKVEVVETMTVWSFGFPFGDDLSAEKGANPSVTVGKAAVSAIRENARGELARIQFEGEVNPGNSGGPLVDAQGRLVGVAAAKVRNTRIGLAVPTPEVARMLDGRPGQVTVLVQRVNDQEPQVKASFSVLDPLGKVRKAALRYVRSTALKPPPKPAADGTWPELADAQVAELNLGKGRAEGILKIELPEKRGSFAVQAVLTLEGDVVRRGQPSLVTVNLEPPKVAANAPAVVKGPAVHAGEEIDGQPFEVEGAKVTPLTVDFRVPGCLTWAADGKSFFLLEEKGVLRRLAVPGLKEEAKRDLGKQCLWMSPSAEGLLVAATGADAVWLLDPTDLQTKKEIAVPGPQRVVSTPGLSLAFAVDRDKNLCMLDLKKGEVAKRIVRGEGELREARFDKCGVSPDGKYLFCGTAWNELWRLRIEDGGGLKPEQRSPKVAFGYAEAFCFSPDGKYVCLPTGNGNQKVEGLPDIHGGGTYVFAAEDLSKVAFGVANAPFAAAVAFDPKSGAVYGQNREQQLIVFSAQGFRQKAFGFDRAHGQVVQILAHPDGGRLVVLARGKLWYVELR